MSHLMRDYFEIDQESWEIYNKTTKDKNFTYGVPKERLLIQLDPLASDNDIGLIIVGLMLGFINK